MQRYTRAISIVIIAFLRNIDHTAFYSLIRMGIFRQYLVTKYCSVSVIDVVTFYSDIKRSMVASEILRVIRKFISRLYFQFCND